MEKYSELETEIVTKESFLLSAAEIIVNSEQLPENMKGILLNHLEDIPTEKEDIPTEILKSIATKDYRAYSKLIPFTEIRQLTPERICSIMYLRREGIELGEILKKRLFLYPFEMIVQKSTYYKNNGIHLLNVLTYHPEYTTLTPEELEEIRLENIQHNPISNEFLELVDNQNKDIYNPKNDNRLDTRIIKPLTYNDHLLFFKTLENLRMSLREWESIKHAKESVQEIMIIKNKGLVLRCFHHIARSIPSDIGIDKEGLIQAGNMGMLDAIEAFDYKKGYQFSTYATWWIRQRMQRELSRNSGPIRIPHITQSNTNQYNKAIRNISEKGKSTDKEIMSEIGISRTRLKNIKSVNHAHNVSSLDEQLGEGDDDFSLYNKIADESIPNPEKAALDNIYREQLIEILDKTLSYREKYIIMARAGMFDGEKFSLELVSRKLGITRERVRQIESNSLEKVRNYIIKNKIKFENGE